MNRADRRLEDSRLRRLKTQKTQDSEDCTSTNTAQPACTRCLPAAVARQTTRHMVLKRPCLCPRSRDASRSASPDMTPNGDTSWDRARALQGQTRSKGGDAKLPV